MTIKTTTTVWLALAVALVSNFNVLPVQALVVSPSKPTSVTTTTTSRRQWFNVVVGGLAATTIPSRPAQADTGANVRGIDMTPFNGLIFNYRASDSPSSLQASDLDEPSISYADFCQKLKDGQVQFVEFMAPNGDAAYATLKGQEDNPIRVGEGTPQCVWNIFVDVTGNHAKTT